ncbi:MAG: hypothetical protein F4Z28_18050 [Gammaproteobacteria bacterium]|nr:hypothetical protein [Gammaproteobacteria bacterium]
MNVTERKIPRRRFLAGVAVAIAAAAVPACRPGDDLQVEPVEQLETGGFIPSATGVSQLQYGHETVLPLEPFGGPFPGQWQAGQTYNKGDLVIHRGWLWVAQRRKSLELGDFSEIPLPQVVHK